MRRDPDAPPLDRPEVARVGARWLRCDLHVHTPFDAEKRFGEDIQGAIDSLQRGHPEPLARIADRFVQACRNAAQGEGLDLVAITDHNSIEGYRRLRPEFDNLARQAAGQGLEFPTILPGVEFSVDAELIIHILVIFAAGTDPDRSGNLSCLRGDRALRSQPAHTPRHRRVGCDLPRVPVRILPAILG